MVVSDQLRVPAALTSRKESLVYTGYEAGWVPEHVLEIEIDSTVIQPVAWSLYSLSYSGSNRSFLSRFVPQPWRCNFYGKTPEYDRNQGNNPTKARNIELLINGTLVSNRATPRVS
jgi:hypothetical protein